jgi:hypothetical protein
MLKNCSKCKIAFDCCNEKEGCWCENLEVSLEKLALLKKEYDNCLCSNCLKEYAIKA